MPIDVEPNLYLLEAKYESHNATIYELKCILCSMRFVERDGAIKSGEVLCIRILGPPGFHCTILYSIFLRFLLGRRLSSQKNLKDSP